LLTRINVPKDEIDVMTDKIYQRRFQEMFTLIEPYDVQETRRLEREKNQAEFQTEREKNQAELKKAQTELEKMRLKEKETIWKLKQKHMSNEDIADVLSIPIEIVRNETRFTS
jgi:ssRNA-specific RNase YbeY (16S rRNA maturation enzyme)